MSSGKIRSSNVDLKSNWSGKTISFPHNWIILIDMLSQPWALSALRFFIMRKMSFSLILEEFKGLSILYLNFGNVLAFLTGAHWSTKCGLKSSDFILKWNTSLPSLPHGWHFSFVQKSTYDGPIYFWSCIRGYLKKWNLFTNEKISIAVFSFVFLFLNALCPSKIQIAFWIFQYLHVYNPRFLFHKEGVHWNSKFRI